MATYVWQRTDLKAGLGLVRLDTGDAIRASGSEIALDESSGWLVTFDIELDRKWRTRRVEASVRGDEGHRTVALEGDGQGLWMVDGHPAPGLTGCIDVDIAATPFTNTIVIRRVEIPIGDTVEVRVAWIGIPDLGVSAVAQTYRRLEPANGVDRYEYRRSGSPTGWVIDVDEDGVALEYEGFARRVIG